MVPALKELTAQEGKTHGDSTNQDALCATLEGKDLKAQGVSCLCAVLVVVVVEKQ